MGRCVNEWAKSMKVSVTAWHWEIRRYPFAPHHRDVSKGHNSLQPALPQRLSLQRLVVMAGRELRETLRFSSNWEPIPASCWAFPTSAPFSWRQVIPAWQQAFTGWQSLRPKMFIIDQVKHLHFKNESILKILQLCAPMFKSASPPPWVLKTPWIVESHSGLEKKMKQITQPFLAELLDTGSPTSSAALNELLA